jgi:hypothetical protein
MNKHPSEGDLLLYLDGELERETPETVRQHLDSCWTCRMHAAGIQNAIVEFARERERTRPPEPPSPWRDLGSDLQRLHGTTRPSFLQRIRSGGVVLFAAATAIAAVTWWSLPRQTPIPAAPKQIVPAAPALPQMAEMRRPELPKVPERIALDPSVMTHQEVMVVARLHELKADLGEPIELERTSADRLVLTGSGLSADRAQQIRQALAGLPDLTMHFVVPHATGGSSGLGAPAPVARRAMAFEAELIQYAGGRPALEKLTDSVLDAGDQLTMYVHALDNLEKRFAGVDVSSEDRAVLDGIQRDDRSNAAQAARALARLLGTIYDKLAIERTAPRAQQSLMQATLNVDRLLNATFAGAQSDLTDRELYSQLRASVDRVLELLA